MSRIRTTPLGPSILESPESKKYREQRAKEYEEEANLLWEVAKHPELAAQEEGKINKAINLVGETIPYITATTAAYVVAGPMGGFAVGSMVEGNSAYKEAIDSGVSEDKAKTIGVGVGIVSGAIEAFGGKYAEQLLLKATAKLKSKLAKAGAVFTIGTAVEALEEGAQEIAAIAGEETYRDVDWNETATRIAGAMAGGAFLGGAMRGASIATKRLTQFPDKPLAERGMKPVEPTKEHAKLEEDLTDAIQEKTGLPEEQARKVAQDAIDDKFYAPPEEEAVPPITEAITAPTAAVEPSKAPEATIPKAQVTQEGPLYAENKGIVESTESGEAVQKAYINDEISEQTSQWAESLEDGTVLESSDGNTHILKNGQVLEIYDAETGNFLHVEGLKKGPKGKQQWSPSKGAIYSLADSKVIGKGTSKNSKLTVTPSGQEIDIQRVEDTKISTKPVVDTETPVGKPQKPYKISRKEITYEKSAFGKPYPDKFPAYEVEVKDHPEMDIITYKAKGGWLVTNRKTGEIFAEKKPYKKGYIYAGEDTPQKAVKKWAQEALATPTPPKAEAKAVEKKEGAEPSGGVSWQQAMKSVLDLAEKDRPKVVSEQKKARGERVGAMAGTMDWLRKKGVSGKEAIHKSAGKLKGALADYEGRYQPLSQILKPSTIEAAENDMADSDNLSPFDKISLTNHEGTGAWDKMLKGAAMTPGDVKLIRKWQPILAIEAAKRVPLSSRVWEGLEWMLGTLKFGAAFDVQIRRQARWLRGKHPVLFTKAVGRDLAAYVSGNYADKMAKETTSSPYHEQAQRYGLRFLNRQPASTEQRPEQFVSSLPETLPWLGKHIGTGYKYTGGQVGKVYAASMRGFVDSFNWMQQKMWDMQIEKWKSQNIEITQKMLHDLVDFQNTMLGMSKPKTNFGSAVNRVMRPVMWSPSLTWSRIRTPSLMLSNPTMRGEVAASLSTYIGTGLMYLAAASMLAKWWGKEDPVEWDINSSDFGKIRIGDTRWDVFGDGGPYIRAILQAWAGTKKNQAGRVVTKEGFEKLDPFKQLLRNKRAPALDLFAKIWSGRNYYGGDAWALPDYDAMRKEGGTKAWFADWHEGQMEDEGKEVGFFISKEVYDRYMPFFIQSTLEAAWFDGWPQALGAGTDEFFSGQALTYEPSTASELQIVQDIAATQEYDKVWDELTPRQQEKLYRQIPEMEELEMKKASEKLPPEEISLTRQNRAAKRIFRAMPDEVKKEMNAVGAKISAPGRKVGKFFLNENRYTAYEEYSRQEIEKQLSKTISSGRYTRMDKVKRMQKLKDDITEAKADARKRLLREINRGDL
ncbi:MAG TPA: hypothetical protein VMW45_00500 [Dehalococcoidia bacterium]|nr:hypothetical protein [Dehalococcoidia bacterium]